jgi:hypothetical protein
MILAFWIAVSLIGCASMQPKQKAAAMMLSYNKAYDDYQIRVTDPNLTAEQKEILQKQKVILTELYPKIKLYAEYVEGGKVPYRGIEAEINNLLFELEKLVLAPPD